MKIRSLFLVVTLLILSALSLAKITHPAPLSACTWVVTSCGSGCADNKDLYNCSSNVSVKSVSPDNKNQDSNNKAKIVAPPTVTQYIDGDASKVSESTKKVIDTPEQKASSNTTTTDDTGMGGSTKQAQGTVATVVENYTTVPGLTAGTAGSSGGVCPNNAVTATSCRGKPLGTKVGSLVCIGTPDGCALMTPPAGGAYEGVYGYVSRPADNNSGSCRAVVTCSCPTGTKQYCANTGQYAYETGFPPLSSNVAKDCAQYSCPSVGTGSKVCEPGTVQCTSGTKGKVCNPNGTGYNSVEVEAHACGSTKLWVPQYCIRGTTNCASTKEQCEATKKSMGTGLGSIPCELSSEYVPSTAGDQSGALNCSTTPNRSVFVGCGTGDQSAYNCFVGCKNGQQYGKTCVNQPGLSCGAKEGVATPPPQTPPPASTPPASNPPGSPPPPSSPRPSPNPSPQPGQCVSISKSVQTPKIGDQVSFTCAPVNLATRYEFRYAYATTNTVSENQYQALPPTSATANTSASITVDKVGRYVAMCRPCFGNNQCETWQVATLQEQD